jgi:hypothetical protein
MLMPRSSTSRSTVALVFSALVVGAAADTSISIQNNRALLGYTAKNISSSPSDYYTAKNTSSSNHTYYVAQNASSYYDAGSDSNAPVYYTAPNVTGSDSDKVYYVAKNASSYYTPESSSDSESDPVYYKPPNMTGSNHTYYVGKNFTTQSFYPSPSDSDSSDQMVYYVAANMTNHTYYNANKTYYVVEDSADSDSNEKVYYVPANVTFDSNKTYYVAKSYYPNVVTDSDSDAAPVYYVPANVTGNVTYYDTNKTYYVAKDSGSDSNSDAAVYYVPANKTYDANQTYYTKKSYWPSASDSDEDVTTQSIRIMDVDTGADGVPMSPISTDPGSYLSPPPIGAEAPLGAADWQVGGRMYDTVDPAQYAATADGATADGGVFRYQHVASLLTLTVSAAVLASVAVVTVRVFRRSAAAQARLSQRADEEARVKLLSEESTKVAYGTHGAESNL